MFHRPKEFRPDLAERTLNSLGSLQLGNLAPVTAREIETYRRPTSTQDTSETINSMKNELDSSRNELNALREKLAEVESTKNAQLSMLRRELSHTPKPVTITLVPKSDISVQTLVKLTQSGVQTSFTEQPKVPVLRRVFDVEKKRVQISKLRKSQSELREAFSRDADGFRSLLQRRLSEIVHVLSTKANTAVDQYGVGLRDEIRDMKREWVEIRNFVSSQSLEIDPEGVVSTIKEMVVRSYGTELEAVREKLKIETAARRKLHNRVLELKGNIRVFLRIRPLLPKEVQSGAQMSIVVQTDTDIDLTLGVGRSGQIKSFSFDRVFGPETDNNDLFNELHQLVISSMDGFNVAILAYGITGSGKTYTMEGIYERLGIDLFVEKSARERIGGWEYGFSLSVCEVYNESIIDFLSLKNIDTNVRMNPNTGMFHIPGLTKVPIASTRELSKLLKDSSKNRSVSSTNCNQQSSRSHLITTVHVAINTPNQRNILAKLCLVDLAGSERLDKTGATGSVAKEGVAINKSLSALGDVINARVNKAAHVPYRNSVLTSALQECVAGESKTLMILQATPSDESCDETCNSLVFGARVRDVEGTKSPSSPRRKQSILS